MRVVFRMSAIVAALVIAVASSAALTGCGQAGALYLPTVPPLPPKPAAQTETPPEDAASDADAASSPDASTPLTLAPANELAASSPPAKRPSPASAASSSAPSQ
jgi:predicted small lipoprotein YifL